MHCTNILAQYTVVTTSCLISYALYFFQILEITLLVASYINAIVRQQGLTFDVKCTTKKTSGAAEKNIKVWDMESAEWPMLPGAGLI